MSNTDFDPDAALAATPPPPKAAGGFDPDAALKAPTGQFDPDAALAAGPAPTGIWPAIKQEAANTWDTISSGLGPSNTEQTLKEMQERPFWDITPQLRGMGRFAKGALTAAGIPVQAVSVPVAAGMAELGQFTGLNYDPDKIKAGLAQGLPREEIMRQAQETPAQAYSRWRGNVDTALLALPYSKTSPFSKAVPTAAPTPPVEGPFGVTLSQGEDAGDYAKRAAESRLARSGDKHALAFAEQRREQLAEAPQIAAAGLDAANQVVAGSPQVAADVVGAGLAHHQAQVDALVKNSEQALTAMHESIRSGLSPTGTVLAREPLDAANVIQGAIANEAERAQAAIDAAYTDLRNLPGHFHPAAFNQIGEKIIAKLNQGTNPIRISPEITPQANHAVQDLDDILSGIKQERDEAGQIVPRKPITPQVVEETRKRLNSYYGDALQAARASNNWSDVRAMRGVMDAFDAQVANRLKKGTFIGGDATQVVSTMEKARGLYADYRNTFTPRGAGDSVGQAIQKVLGRYEGSAATPEQIQGMLYSPTNPQAVQIAGRLKEMFGATSPEFGAAKQGLYSFITERPAGGEAWGPEKVADRIDQFTKGPGRSLAQAYFNPDEIAKVQELGARLRSHAKGAALAENPFEGANFDALFRRTISQDPKALAQLEEAHNRLGINSPYAAALRQGLFLKAVTPIEGVPQRGAGQIADQLSSLLTATRNSSIYTPEHRALIQSYADLMRKLQAPKGMWEPSGPAIDRLKQSIEHTIGQMVGYAIARHIPGAHFGLDLLGIRLGGEGASFLARRNVNKIRQQLPLVSEQMDKYQKAFAAWQRNQNPGTKKLLGVATSNLAEHLKPWGIDFSRLPLGLPGTAPAQDQQNPRKAGGGVTLMDDNLTPEQNLGLGLGEAGVNTIGSQGAPRTGEGLEAGLKPEIQAPGGGGYGPEPIDVPGVGPVLSTDTGFRAVNRLMGLGGEERFQTWPERLIRSGMTLAGDVMSGKTPVWDPDTGHTSEEVIQRSQDMAALAGGAGMPAAEEGALGMTGGKFKITAEGPRFGSKGLEGEFSYHPDYVYHGTSTKHLPDIQEAGLLKGTHITTDPHTAWQEAEFAVDGDPWETNPKTGKYTDAPGAGGKPVVLAIDKNALRSHMFREDQEYNKDSTWGRAAQVLSPIDSSAIKNILRSETQVSKHGSALKNSMMNDTVPLNSRGDPLFSDTQKPGAALSALEHSQQPLYSAVEKTIAEAPQQKMQASQWSNWLRNQPGVKKEELSWLGLDNPENLPQGLVTKDQLLQHARENGVGLKEVEKGGPNLDEDAVGETADRLLHQWENETPTIRGTERAPNTGLYVAQDYHGNVIGYGNTRQEALTSAENAIREIKTQDPDTLFELSNEVADNTLRHYSGGTKYAGYQLPGGENYREMLLTMPADKGAKIKAVPREGGGFSFQANGQTFGAIGHLEGMTQAMADQMAREQFPSSQLGRAPSESLIYRTSHWDEPNVLAHLRMNDRDIPGVGKSLHLEELQSDLHQQGRKQGYRTAEPLSNAEREELQKLRNKDTPTNDERLRMFDLEQRRQGAASGSIPDFPFKQTWPDLLLKRAITKAIRESAITEQRNWFNSIDSSPEAAAHALANSGYLKRVCD